MIFDDRHLAPNACFVCGGVLNAGYVVGADRRRRCVRCYVALLPPMVRDSRAAVERFAAVLVLRQRQLIRQRAGREG